MSLPSGGELTDATADAVTVASGVHASCWARNLGRWDWTVSELLAALNSEEE